MLPESFRRTMALPRAGLDLSDAAALAVVTGFVGGIVLLSLLVAWWAGLGLLFATLVLWGSTALRGKPPQPPG